jgi:lipopolysaccharide heptosyltransferase II
MRQHRFDWVIDLQSLARSGAFAWLANGKLLVGLDDGREGARGFYDIVVPRASYLTHAVDWYLAVLKALDVPTSHPFIWLPPRAADATTLRQKWRPGAAEWIIVVPGARWQNKRWPAEYFAVVVQQLARENDQRRFAILGSKDDRLLGETIATAAPQQCLNLAGQTTLGEMIEWLRLGAVVLTNDTGPMHIAAALRKPVVALFGPTEPRRTGPYGQVAQALQTRLECVPCMKGECNYSQPLECLRAIRPEMVLPRLRTALAMSRASSGEEWRWD